jgi:hypothetical protein
MNAQDKPKFASLVVDVLGYYKQDVSQFTLSVWWNGCKKFEFEQVAKALSDHATDPDKGQWAPKVADIVRILGGTRSDRSLREWSRVYEAMGSVGAYQDVDFGDGATHSAIRDMGGWPKLCRSNLDDLSYLQHRFCELYKVHDGNSAGAPALMGDRSPDEMYRRKGLPVPSAVLIAGSSPTDYVNLEKIDIESLVAISMKKF